MRQLLVVFALGLLGACDDGVVIEVHSDAVHGVAKVELFIARDQMCNEMDCSIQPAGETAPLPGYIYTRDSAPRFADDTDASGVAKFRLEAGDEINDVYLFVAVGLDAQDQPIAAALVEHEIDPAGPARYIVDLVKAAPRLGAENDVPEHVKIWNEAQGDKSSCLAYERWSSNALEVRKFIVPADDPDCDDRTGESDVCEMIYGPGSPEVTSDDMPACIGAPVDAPDACAFGAQPICAEPDDDSCVGGRTCVPTAVCESCRTALEASPGKFLTCLFGANTVGSTTTLNCDVGFTQTEVDGHGVLEPCDTSDATFDFDHFNDSGGCAEPQFYSFDRDMMLLGSAMTGDVDVATVNRQQAISMRVQADDDNASSGCKLKLKFRGELVNVTGAPPAMAPLLMRVAANNQKHEIVLPMQITTRLDQACVRPASCQLIDTSPGLNGPEQIFTCVP